MPCGCKGFYRADGLAAPEAPAREVAARMEGMIHLNCLAYIDLNPVRAGLVEKPKD